MHCTTKYKLLARPKHALHAPSYVFTFASLEYSMYVERIVVQPLPRNMEQYVRVGKIVL